MFATGSAAVFHIAVRIAPVLGQNDLKGGTGDDRRPNQNWAPMALVDGKLLIRDQGQLKCVKVAQ